MAEDLSNDFIVTARHRSAVKSDSVQAELVRLAAEEQAANATAPKPAAAAAPAAPGKPASAASTTGLIVSESIKAVGGAAYDATKSTVNLIDDAAQWLDKNYLNTEFGVRALRMPDAPEWAQNKTTAGKVARSIGQFAIPYLGAVKALRIGNAVVRGATAGAAVDFVAMDPADQRLSNLLLDMTDNDPVVGKAILEYLKSDAADAKMEGRFKGMLEGAIVGLGAEAAVGLYKGFRATRAHLKAKNVAPEEVIEAARTARQTVADATVPAEMPLQQQIEVTTGAAERKAKSAKDSAEVFEAPKADSLTTTSNYDSLTPSAAAKPADEVADRMLQRQGATELALDAPKITGDVIDFPTPTTATNAGERLTLVEDMVVKNPAKVRHAFLEDGEIVFSREAPSPAALPIEQTVQTALAKSPLERTAEDLIAIRAYRQMQEAAFPGIVVPGAGDAAAQAIQVVEVAGTGRTAITHKLRKEIREGAPEAAAKEAPTGKTPKAAPAKEAAGGKPTRSVEIAKGDTVFYNGGADSGAVIKVGKNGKVIIKDDATGATRTVTPDVADPWLAEVAANNAAISKVRTVKGKNSQGGFVSPAVLANMAAASVGAAAGYGSADDDAAFAEKLSLAFGGALAGVGIKAGATKVFTSAERAVIDAADPVVKSLSHPAVRNIVPAQTLPVGKKPPVIQRAKVDELVAAARTGGYKSLAEAVKKSDFNFDHIDTQGDVKQMIDAFSSVFEKETTLAKHGTQSFSDIRELADELGAGKQSLQALAAGTDNLGARILAHRALLAASAEKVTNLARIVNDTASGVRTEDAIVSLRKHVALHAAVQAQMKGVQTEVARALAQFRIQANSASLATNEVNQLVESLGGHAANIKFARDLQAITDPKGLNLAIRRGAMARTQSALVESIVLGKLWAPTTHVANAVGNMITAVGSLAERQVASLSGRYLRNAPDAIQQGEVKAQLFGMIAGVKDALRITAHGLQAVKTAAGKAATRDIKGARAVLSENSNEFGTAWQAMGTGAPVGRAGGGTAEDVNLIPAIGSTAAGWDPKSWLGKAADFLGTATRIPGHALAAADELFYAMHNRGELHALAFREASGKGLEGQQFIDEVARLIEDPTPTMSSKAQRAGQDGTFTTPLTGGQQKISDLINDSATVKGIPLGRIVVPFVRTPMNILNYVGQRTPLLNRMSASYEAAIKEGGPAADLARAKTATGSMLLMTGAVLATEMEFGDTKIRLHGGGDLRKTSEKLGGFQAYSLEVNGKFYAFNRLDPFGMFLGLAADFRDIAGHVDEATMGEVVSAATLSLGRNLASKSYLSGLIDLTEALSQSTRGNTKPLERYFNETTAGLIPFVSASNVARKVADPVMREVNSLMDAIKNKIPGFSSELPPMLNLFGEEVLYKGGLGPDIASPISTTERTTDLAANEIARLNIDLQPPARSIGGIAGAPNIELTPQQYHQYALVAGRKFKELATSTISAPGWKDLPSDPQNDKYVDAKEKTLRMLHEAAKKYAYAELLKNDPSFKAAVMENGQNAVKALSTIPQ